MKLLKCNKCHDIFNLTTRAKHCSCKKCGGIYHNDKLNAFYWGDCIVLGIDNFSFVNALKDNCGDFKAFIIEENCNTIHRIKKPKWSTLKELIDKPINPDIKDVYLKIEKIAEEIKKNNLLDK